MGRRLFSREFKLEAVRLVRDRGQSAPWPPTFWIGSSQCKRQTKWVADFTSIWTAEGWLYVACVLDLFPRRVVGWSMSATMTAQLVTDALMMAIWCRGKLDALLYRSDRGGQYTAEPFQKLMADHGVTCSMSRSGNGWDNAVMESFFSSLKIERIAHKVYQTSDQARADVFDYVERFYNPTRRHSTIGYISPNGIREDRRGGLKVVSTKPAAAQIVGYATAAEPAAFTNRPSSELVDEITRWAVISVRSTPAGRMTTQHAIGWLDRLAIPWITSPLRDVRSRPPSVDTISGQPYRLVGQPGEPVGADLLTVVSEHLACLGCTEIMAVCDRLGV